MSLKGHVVRETSLDSMLLWMFQISVGETLPCVLHQHVWTPPSPQHLTPYNTTHHLVFLDTLLNIFIQPHEGEPCGPQQLIRYTAVWDNLSIHHAASCSSLVEDFFFPFWHWKVYHNSPHQHMTLLKAMGDVCSDIRVKDCQAWISHSKVFFHLCFATENILCNIDELLGPNREERVYADQLFFSYCFL